MRIAKIGAGYEFRFKNKLFSLIYDDNHWNTYRLYVTFCNLCTSEQYIYDYIPISSKVFEVFYKYIKTGTISSVPVCYDLFVELTSSVESNILKDIFRDVIQIILY